MKHTMHQAFGWASISLGRRNRWQQRNESEVWRSQQCYLFPIKIPTPHLQGMSGVRPQARNLLASIQSHDMFVYCGHGSGEQYVPLPLMRRLQGQCASALLVGCSSGRLRLGGAGYDPAGAVVSYMLSGEDAILRQGCFIPRAGFKCIDI